MSGGSVGRNGKPSFGGEQGSAKTVGKNFRYMPIHEIVTSIGVSKSQASPLPHAYTGYDSVSSFSASKKKSA